MNLEHRFTYTAGQLREPLRKLRAFLIDYIAKNADAARESSKLVRMKSSLGTMSDSEVLAARTLNDMKAAQYDLARCELWIGEVDRLWWWKKFSLDENELKFLHRYRASLPS